MHEVAVQQCIAKGVAKNYLFINVNEIFAAQVGEFGAKEERLKGLGARL